MSIATSISVESIRASFPVLDQKVNGKPLIYFDNAATSQKPQRVIDALVGYYQNDNANIHRGIHTLAERATTAYEETRKKVRSFIHAREAEEIVFTKGTTEGINLIAQSYGRKFLKKDDEILISGMEHHSNIVPWQQCCETYGAVLKVIPMKPDGTLDIEAYRGLLNEKTKMVAVTHVSNVLGTLNPIKQMIADAHALDVPVLIDGSQSVPHLPIDVQDLDCDFFVFSSHKMYGPTGVGVLYAKEAWLEAMPPYQFGGDMIQTVSFEQSTFNVLPYKFEAGTPNMAGVMGLGEAITFLDSVNKQNVHQYEAELLDYTRQCLNAVSGVRMLGINDSNIGVVSFVMKSAHSHDVATILDEQNVAVRAGHHCAMPLMSVLGVPATARISLAAYTTREEIDHCVRALVQVNQIFVMG